MDLQDGFIESSRGHQLYCRYWKPQGEPRALAFVCHGFAEHSGYYNDVAEVVAAKGFLVAAHDHVGHGRSGGERVLVTTFDEYVDDIFLHLDQVRAQLPVFLIGHSLGGLMSLYCALRRPADLQGIVLIGPLIAIHSGHTGVWKQWLVSVVGRWFPSFQFPGLRGSDSSNICRDRQHVRRYDEDPLVWHQGAKAGFAAQVVPAMWNLESRMSEITCPLLIIQGSADVLTDPEGSKTLHQKASSTEKQLSLYEGAYHQVHNEPEGMKERCLQEIASWLDHRASGGIPQRS